MAKGRYEPAFDGLRGIAVLVVVATHAIPNLPTYGGLGVNIFFVLSGYLITRLLVVEMDRTGTINLGRFYLQRALRLMPPFWAMLLIFLPLILTGHHRISQMQSWAMAATYLMNFNIAFGWTSNYAFVHTWSLAAQEQFYLLWPPALLLGARYRPRLILAALLVFAMLWRAYLYAHGASLDRIYYGPDTNSDAILVGCLLAFANIPAIWGRRLAVAWPAWLLALAGAIIFCERLPDIPQYVAEASLVSILGALLIVAAPASSLGILLSAEPLRFLGKISYGLYLWHAPLIIFFGARWHLSGWQVLLPIACALVLATISYFTVEAWARRLKRGLKREGSSTGLGVEIGYAPQGVMPP
jgi:peptidoglycan/LPS O-acetylase OafA/YrhL